MENRVHVLDSEVKLGDLIQQVGSSLGALVVEFDEPFVLQGGGRRDAAMRTCTWRQSGEGGATVTLADDTQIPARWLSITARSEAECQHISSALALLLPLVSVDYLRTEAEKPGADLSALIRLALGLNRSFDRSMFSRIVRLLEDEEIPARTTCALCALLLKWPQLAVHLENALASETNDETKRTLRLALSECR